MIIPKNSLIKNHDAFEKYKERLVKIYNESYGTWISKDGLCRTRELTPSYTLFEAMFISDNHYGNISFYFASKLGEVSQSISECDIEDIYNNPTLIFENYKPTY
jgi:hypothetical protein